MCTQSSTLPYHQASPKTSIKHWDFMSFIWKNQETFQLSVDDEIVKQKEQQPTEDIENKQIIGRGMFKNTKVSF